MRRVAYSLRYFGSKSYQIKQIMDEILILNKNKEYDTFVEVFAGSGRLTFAIPDGIFKRKIYNERDPLLVNLMNCLINDTDRAICLAKFGRMPWSRPVFEEQLEISERWNDTFEKHDKYPSGWIDPALATYYIHGYSFMGKGNRMGYFIKSWRNIGKENIEVLERFDENNLQGVIINWANYDKVMSEYDNPKTIFYLDPPYIRESSIYRYGFTIEDYRRLADILSGLDGKYIMNISMEDTANPIEYFGKPTYVIDYHAHAYITDQERPTFGMGYWRNW